MTFLRPHKFWIAALALAVILIFSSSPLLDFLQGGAERHLAEVKDVRLKTEQALQRLEDDIAATRKLSGQIGADEVVKSLASVDRLEAAGILEKQAAASRLQHFTYTVSPEQEITISNPGASVQELATSTISVKAEAPLDTDVYAFIERVHSAMPGRLRLKSISLERSAAEGVPFATVNLHMAADFEWLSNGATKQMAEGR